MDDGQVRCDICWDNEPFAFSAARIRAHRKTTRHREPLQHLSNIYRAYDIPIDTPPGEVWKKSVSFVPDVAALSSVSVNGQRIAHIRLPPSRPLSPPAASARSSATCATSASSGSIATTCRTTLPSASSRLPRRHRQRPRRRLQRRLYRPHSRQRRATNVRRRTMWVDPHPLPQRQQNRRRRRTRSW